MMTNYQTIHEEIQALFLTDAKADEKTWPIHLTGKEELPGWLTDDQRSWLKSCGFEAKSGSHRLLPGSGGIGGIITGIAESEDAKTPLLPGGLSERLPAGDYRFAGADHPTELTALAWALGQYSFQRYKSGQERKSKRLQLPEGTDLATVTNIAAANWLARNLINTPANDLGPAELESAVRDVAAYFDAECDAITGDALLDENFPLIHAVGRASTRQPRLIDLRWGDPDAVKITIVGKGICFDTGGLNLKPGSNMALMKKDMGGAATALALAAMIMGAKLPVRLRLLIAAAENAVSGNSFRPGDILKSRAGLHVEIGDTDAEGRLVLADALALADEEKPDHIFSFATLTGSARVALGPDLPPVYSTDSSLAAALVETGAGIDDPMWPMPLWAPYNKMIKSRLGDIKNVAQSPFAGSILAALFLNHFVLSANTYTHFDIYGWVPKNRPGKPAGGEPQCARAVFAYLKGAFPKE